MANSAWTRDLALTVLGELGLDGHGQRLRVVHLGTDPGRFRPGVDATELRGRLELPHSRGRNGTRWLLTVARIEPHKGVDTVLQALPAILARAPDVDRKSTRLNSSHSQISYAVFCLKKKKQYKPLNAESVVTRNETIT